MTQQLTYDDARVLRNLISSDEDAAVDLAAFTLRTDEAKARGRIDDILEKLEAVMHASDAEVERRTEFMPSDSLKVFAPTPGRDKINVFARMIHDANSHAAAHLFNIRPVPFDQCDSHTKAGQLLTARHLLESHAHIAEPFVLSIRGGDIQSALTLAENFVILQPTTRFREFVPRAIGGGRFA